MIQDCRGRFESEGEYNYWKDAELDGIDTMAWIVAQEWSNGVVFTAGVSADGIYGYLTQLGNHDPKMHRGQFLLVGSADLHSMTYGGVKHGGG